MTTRFCPTCSGRWLYSLTFDHGNGCSLRAQDDACRAADAEALAVVPDFTRTATSAEQTLAAALGWPGPAASFGKGSTDATVSVIVTGPTSSIARRQLQTIHHGIRGPVWDPDTAMTEENE